MASKDYTRHEHTELKLILPAILSLGTNLSLFLAAICELSLTEFILGYRNKNCLQHLCTNIFDL